MMINFLSAVFLDKKLWRIASYCYPPPIVPLVASLSIDPNDSPLSLLTLITGVSSV
ncbi:MAG TPA: hypothetical protein VE548_11620 [Nitrososphaeraceae archaeon]|nr:hypothetical protein [Nitrososphaeraceae archaeon]